MAPALTARATLLQALEAGPQYGRELLRGVPHLAPGTLYPALRGLERGGLITSWVVVPRGSRGARARTYYELTLRGVEASAAQRESLLRALLGARVPVPTTREQARMGQRLRSCAELSGSVLELRDRMRNAAH